MKLDHKRIRGAQQWLAGCWIVFMFTGASPAEMIPNGYLFRRSIHFKQAVSDAPGQNAAVVEFYTNGEARADGADIRVTTADQVIVPHKILQISRNDDFVRLAFATLGDGPYYVWWGNAGAAAPAETLDIQRGVYTEILKTPEDALRTTKAADGLKGLFARAAPPAGALFVPQIFLGYNPLGQEWGAMLHYRGQFKIDHPITAEFIFTVDNSGTLAIDGKIIASAFRSRMRGDARDSQSVDLAAGWHTIDVMQANLDGGATRVAVDWKLPQVRDFSPFPASIIAPIAPTWAGPLEKVGAPAGFYVADFAITPQAEAFSPPDGYFQRYTFDATVPDNFKGSFRWNFGDGQTETQLRRVDHLYLAPGDYTVTLEVTEGGAVSRAARRITIKDRMYSRFPSPPEDPPKSVLAALKDYDPQKLTGDGAFRGMLYFKDIGDADHTAAWGKAWAGMKDSPRGQSAFDEAFDLSRLLETRKDFRGAIEVLRSASAKPVSMDTRLLLMREYVITACDYSDDAAGALKEAQGWQKQINEANKAQGRAVQVAIAYAAIAAGDAKLARASLELAEKDAGAPAGNKINDALIRQGVLARDVENYIRTRDFDTAIKLLDEWDLEFPGAMWVGFSRTLRVRLAASEGRPDVAARIALQHAQANPASFYGPELLYLASENFKAAGDTAQAKTAGELLSARYPESDYARGDAKEVGSIP